ncbi:RNA polymerase sigma factor [Saccharothrix obliqua]|uniref:RNA polymerase sigma factor n=1 Tax=Saccharothrix obliqua TaxID=2861747 RepID=UPI001C5DDE63|nr:sigma-70 family RNA polymerase sigma factor [Saccharothrix obliqua]MBW4720423.1 sigma-70 family RNA polymerase sigma factor [Saccharothrix obliqua]
MTSTPDDEDRAKQEFRQFYGANYDALRRQISWWDPAVDHDEIADDAFLQTWRRWRELDNPRAFVYKAARNGLRNGRRMVGRRASPMDLHEGDAALMARPSDVETRQEFQDALDRVERLPPQLRLAVKLHALGLSKGEIATVLGCGKKTVANYLSEARRRLSGPDPEAGGGSGPGGRQDRGDV